ncbi:hypothetical protein [Rhodococcus triatomae]
MSHSSPPVRSDRGVFTRATTVLTTGDTLVHDWYVADGEPEFVLRTADAVEAAGLLPRLDAVLADGPGWHRRATDAVVTRFGDGDPEPAELDDAAHDLVLVTVEVHPGGEVVLHFDDSCGQHFVDGRWPAVRFDETGAVVDVTVEA